MFDPKLNDIGIDFWGISGHKWQCGPGGTGILYVRNGRLSANPAPLPIGPGAGAAGNSPSLQ